MIGLSLSFCVKDILHERVSLGEVDALVTGTAIKDLDTLERVCKLYGAVYWEKDPERGCAIARNLWMEGKIHQPRLDTAHEGATPRWHSELMSQGVRWLREVKV